MRRFGSHRLPASPRRPARRRGRVQRFLTGLAVVGVLVFVVGVARAQFAATTKAGLEIELDPRIDEIRALAQEGRFVDALALQRIVLDETPETEATTRHRSVYWHNIGFLHTALEQWDAAESAFEQALTLRLEGFGPAHPETATTLDAIGQLHHRLGELEAAEASLERARDIRRDALGPSPALASSLSNLGSLWADLGLYGRAEEALVAAHEMQTEVLGPDHPDLWATLNNLGSLYERIGDRDAARSAFERAIELTERHRGSDDLRLAGTLANLSQVADSQGDLETALESAERALDIYRSALGDHRLTATALNNLGGVRLAMGDLDAAERAYEEALEMLEEVVGPEHVVTATLRGNLATVAALRGDHSRAIELSEAAFELRNATLGLQHPDTMAAAAALAMAFVAAGDPDASVDLLRSVLKMSVLVLGDDHPETMARRSDLAWALHAAGRHDASAELHAVLLEQQASALGPDHPDVAATLHAAATVEAGRAQAESALDLRARAHAIEDHNLDVVRSSRLTTERELGLYLEHLQAMFEATVSLALSSGSEAHLALAYDVLLRRKGVVASTLAARRRNLREDLDDEGRRVQDALATLSSRLYQQRLAGPGQIGLEQYRANLRALETEIAALRRELAERSAGELEDTVSLDAVRQSLPNDAVLLEFVMYHPHRPSRPTDAWDAAHYALFALDGASVRGWDLGEADAIDALVEAHVACVRGGPACDPRDTAAELHETLLGSLPPEAANARHIVVAPDGQLALLPFETLSTPDGEYLLETTIVSYVPSGRALARTEARARAADVAQRGSEIQIFARPKYAPESEWQDLPGTETEATAIAALFGDRAIIRLGADASERAVKSLTSPRVLHIATHGFFVDTPRAPPPRSRAALLSAAATPGASAPRPARIDAADPFMRSGLVLTPDDADGQSDSSAERPSVERTGVEGLGVTDDRSAHDGVLTAREVMDLELDATELVVLSACETGLGEVRHGQGVSGLRQAFALAGARSQVMSLWSVSDEATAALMTRFYRHVATGTPRAESLTKARRELAEDGRWEHPYFWGAFVLSGTTDALPEAALPTSVPAREPYGERGCGCVQFVAEPVPLRWAGLMVCLVFVLVGRRQRHADRRR